MAHGDACERRRAEELSEDIIKPALGTLVAGNMHFDNDKRMLFNDHGDEEKMLVRRRKRADINACCQGQFFFRWEDVQLSHQLPLNGQCFRRIGAFAD